MTRWRVQRARAAWRESPDSLKGQAACESFTVRGELLRAVVCLLATLAWCAVAALIVEGI